MTIYGHAEIKISVSVPSRNMLRWTQIRAEGPRPDDTRPYVSVAVGKNIYTFGGRDHLDVHHFNTSSLRWSKVTPGGGEGQDLYSRWGHTAVVIGHVVYIWGGEAKGDNYGSKFQAFSIKAESVSLK